MKGGPPAAAASANVQRAGVPHPSRPGSASGRDGKRQRSFGADQEEEDEWEERQRGRSRAGEAAGRHTSGGGGGGGGGTGMVTAGRSEGREPHRPSAAATWEKGRGGSGGAGSNNDSVKRGAVGRGGMGDSYATANDDAKKNVKMDWRERRPAKKS